MATQRVPRPDDVKVTTLYSQGERFSSAPVSSSRPKANTDSLQRYSVALEREATMLCPAQGFPVPMYR